MTRTGRAALGLSLLAFVVLLICAVWLFSLGAQDWGALVPFYLSILFGAPLAIAGLICAVVFRCQSAEHNTLVSVLIVADLAVIGAPWLTLYLAS